MMYHKPKVLSSIFYLKELYFFLDTNSNRETLFLGELVIFCGNQNYILVGKQKMLW